MLELPAIQETCFFNVIKKACGEQLKISKHIYNKMCSEDEISKIIENCEKNKDIDDFDIIVYVL